MTCFLPRSLETTWPRACLLAGCKWLCGDGRAGDDVRLPGLIRRRRFRPHGRRRCRPTTSPTGHRRPRSVAVSADDLHRIDLKPAGHSSTTADTRPSTRDRPATGGSDGPRGPQRQPVRTAQVWTGGGGASPLRWSYPTRRLIAHRLIDQLSAPVLGRTQRPGTPPSPARVPA
jgi:hypothetical protein